MRVRALGMRMRWQSERRELRAGGGNGRGGEVPAPPPPQIEEEKEAGGKSHSHTNEHASLIVVFVIGEWQVSGAAHSNVKKWGIKTSAQHGTNEPLGAMKNRLGLAGAAGRAGVASASGDLQSVSIRKEHKSRRREERRSSQIVLNV